VGACRRGSKIQPQRYLTRTIAAPGFHVNVPGPCHRPTTPIEPANPSRLTYSPRTSRSLLKNCQQPLKGAPRRRRNNSDVCLGQTGRHELAPQPRGTGMIATAVPAARTSGFMSHTRATCSSVGSAQQYPAFSFHLRRHKATCRPPAVPPVPLIHGLKSAPFPRFRLRDPIQTP
jgi:hypothetical protein